MFIKYLYIFLIKTKKFISGWLSPLLFFIVWYESQKFTVLQYEIEVNSIENLLKLNNKESTQVGIYEEKLLTLFLKFNKINLTNIHFVDENRLEVEELYQFINSKYDLYDKKTVNYEIIPPLEKFLNIANIK